MDEVSKAESDMHAALKRKNKADDVTEDDMESVVFAHNSKPCPLVQDLYGSALVMSTLDTFSLSQGNLSGVQL